MSGTEYRTNLRTITLKNNMLVHTFCAVLVTILVTTSLACDYSNSDQHCTRGKNVASTVITTTSNKYPTASSISKVVLIYYLNQNAQIPSRKRCGQ